MKIAIIFKPYLPIQMPTLGGMSNFVYFLSKGLVNSGHEVTVFCSQKSKLAPGVKLVKPDFSEDKTDVYHAGDKFYNYINKNLKWPRDIVNKSFGELSARFDKKIETYLKAFTRINSEKFDVVHAVTHDILALYPALFSSIPSVISFHGHYTLLGPDFLRMMEFLKKENIKHNCSFVSVSKYIQKEYAKFVKSNLIYNSIDIAPYKLNKDKQDYIVYLGRIDSKKGVEFAIQFSKKYKIPLIIAGQISNQWYFDNKIKLHFCHPELVSGSHQKSRGCRNKFGMTKGKSLIKFIGLVNEKEKNKLLGSAKCLFMPSRHKEAFGRVIIESLACGTPVIAFPNGAIPELVINNQTGFLINEDDLAGAKKAFDKLDSIKPEVCRKFVEKNFILERMVKEYERLYRRIGKQKS